MRNCGNNVLRLKFTFVFLVCFEFKMYGYASKFVNAYN